MRGMASLLPCLSPSDSMATCDTTYSPINAQMGPLWDALLSSSVASADCRPFRRTGGPKSIHLLWLRAIFVREQGIPLEILGVWCFSMSRPRLSDTNVQLQARARHISLSLRCLSHLNEWMPGLCMLTRSKRNKQGSSPRLHSHNS